jgi:hypothetical protein
LRVGPDPGADINQHHVGMLQLTQHRQIIEIGDAADNRVLGSCLEATR